MAALLGADLSGYGGASYTDVAETAWYAPAVAWAKENGVMNGYGDTFRPDAPITREEMCKVFFNILSPNLESPASGTFQDDRAISGWAWEAVYYCSGLGMNTAAATPAAARCAARQPPYLCAAQS